MIISNIWKNKKCIKMFQTTNQPGWPWQVSGVPNLATPSGEHQKTRCHPSNKISRRFPFSHGVTPKSSMSASI
jgi:hypothetical protein